VARPRGKAEGILHAVPYAQPARVSAGYYEQLEEAGVVLICCGVVQRPLSAATASPERRPSHRRTRRRDSAMGFQSQLMMTFEARNQAWPGTGASPDGNRSGIAR
jgi:hypothetical protein